MALRLHFPFSFSQCGQTSRCSRTDLWFAENIIRGKNIYLQGLALLVRQWTLPEMLGKRHWRPWPTTCRESLFPIGSREDSVHDSSSEHRKTDYKSTLPCHPWLDWLLVPTNQAKPRNVWKQTFGQAFSLQMPELWDTLRLNTQDSVPWEQAGLGSNFLWSIITKALWERPHLISHISFYSFL